MIDLDEYQDFWLDEYEKLNESKIVKMLDLIMDRVLDLYVNVVSKIMEFIIKKRWRRHERES